MRGTLVLATLAVLIAGPAAGQEPASPPPPPLAPPSGEALYLARCSNCHGAAADAEAQARAGPSRIPARVLLEKMPPEHIVEALTYGAMVEMANGLSDADIAAITTYLTKKPVLNPQ